MPKRAFLLSLFILIPLVLISSPPLLKPYLSRATKTVTATIAIPTVTPTASATPDPFAFAPTATAFGNGVGQVFIAPILPTPALGGLPSIDTSVTTLPAAPTSARLLSVTPSPATPTSVRVSRRTVPDFTVETGGIPVPPAPNGDPPEWLSIPALALEASVSPVGMILSDVAPGVFEWDVPVGRIAGWLNTSAPLGQPGNTVLDGHHNIQGEVFRNLWELVSGDEITLSSGEHSRRYRVNEVLILSELDQPLEVRLKNAAYIRPTTDERLTLITCWPYTGNTHRVVVIAFPE